MLEKYSRVRLQLLEIMDETIQLAQERKLTGTSDHLSQTIATKLRQREFYLVVLGEFNAGKSTLINSLLGKDVLPTSVRPTTATLNLLKYDETASATAVTYNGESENIPLDELSEYVTVSGHRTENIAYVDICYPLDLLKEGVIIVDTPGVNDLNLQRTEITTSYLPKADAALFLIDCKQPVSDSQIKFLQEKVLQSTIQKIFFIVNKIDQINEEEQTEVIPYIQEELRRVIAEPRVFAISAKSPTDENFKKFINTLTDFFNLEKGNLILISALAGTSKAINDIKQSIAVENQTLTANLTELDEKIKKLQPELKEKHAEKQKLLQSIDDKIEEINTYFVSSLQVFTHEFSQKAVEEVQTADINDLKKYLAGYIESRFTEWLDEENQRITDELRTLAAESLERAGEIIKNLEEQFGKIMDVPSSLDLDITYFSQDMTLFLGEGLIIFFSFYLLPTPLALVSTIIGGGGLYSYMKDRRDEKFREETIKRTKSAINETSNAIKPVVYEQLTNFSTQLKDYVSKTIETTIASLEETLENVRSQRKTSEMSAKERQEYLRQLQQQVDTLEQNLQSLRDTI